MALLLRQVTGKAIFLMALLQLATLLWSIMSAAAVEAKLRN
jgi:hypothetical protein